LPTSFAVSACCPEKAVEVAVVGWGFVELRLISSFQLQAVGSHTDDLHLESVAEKRLGLLNLEDREE
jgi:hypothetical protein